MPVLAGEGPRAGQLYAAIRGLIESGLVAPGSKLPPTRELARRLGLSRGAAVIAFDMLGADGFTEARVGAGTFVAGHVPQLKARSPARKADPSPALVRPCALGAAVPDVRTLEVFRKLLSRHLVRPDRMHFHYGDPRGGAALREAVAAYLGGARGVRCDAEQVVITSGTQQGLDLVVRAALRPGDPVWIEDPCYPMARAAFSGAGVRLVGVPVDGDGLDPAIGAGLCPGARAAYVTPSHQYPLGVIMTMRRRLALIEWARTSGAWIIEDDYDSEFRYAGPPLTALQGMDGAGRVAYLGTFSKVLFPGLRVGYAVLPEPLLGKVVDLRSRTDRQPPTLAEAALADLLDEGHFAAHLRRTRRRIEAARDALAGALAARCGDGLSLSVPRQGLHLVARLASRRPDTEIVATLAAREVAARALSPMYVDAAPENGLVLGFSGFTAEALDQAARTIASVLP